MEKILLIMMLTQPVELSNDKDKADQLKGIEKPAPIERHEFIKICSKNEKREDCRQLTQSELSSGTVRGIKIDVDNPQP